MYPYVYEIYLLYPHVFVIAYNATLVSHSSLSQHNSCHPCFLNAPISSLSLGYCCGPLLHSLWCVSLIFFVFFMLSFPASLLVVLSLLSPSSVLCLLFFFYVLFLLHSLLLFSVFFLFLLRPPLFLLGVSIVCSTSVHCSADATTATSSTRLLTIEPPVRSL